MHRKQAAKDFKERKVAKRVFAVRCAATGKAWVDAPPNLGAARNGLWFQLRNGVHRDKRLQAELNAHGEQSFEFEILRALADDVSALNVR